MMLLEMILAAVLGTIIYLFLTKKKEEVLPIGDGWWAAGQKSDSEEDTTIRPFKVVTSEEEIKDLHQRLDKARFVEPLEDSYFHYGFNGTYLKKIVSYWRNQFNWKKQVEILNQFPQFKTKIEGIDVHFLHIKPPHLSEGQSAKPLLMIHGWPGSVYEMYKIIPLLTDPSNHGLNGDHVFEMICPSIPGFGFSEAPHKKGFNPMCAARVFYKLMLKLGFHKFYIQGGDYGSLICTNMAQIAPRHVKGIHINIVFLSTISFKQLLSILLGQYFPKLFGFQAEEIQKIFPFKKKVLYRIIRESGYLHLQATKPDTVEMWGSIVIVNRGLPVFCTFTLLTVAQRMKIGADYKISEIKKYGSQQKGTAHICTLLGAFASLQIVRTCPDMCCGLYDSPVGLAAYILEKFSRWTDPSFKNLEDGGLEKKFTLDDLLTNIMIYWASGCVVSSMRFYKELFWKGIGVEKHETFPVEVPTGIATFPNEVLYIPQSWVQKKYVNIVSFNFMPRGGHFAAFEEPELLAADILQFVDKVEKAAFVQ